MTKTKQLDPKTFGDWAYLALQKHFQKTNKHESDVLKDRDPEALHQMRVGMRRLRTAITGFAPAIDLPKAAQEKNIAKVARRLGELRDIDVLQDALENHYFPALPTQEQGTLKKVLSTLEKQRQKSFEQVQSTLKEQPYPKLKRAFKDWLEKPAYAELAEISIDELLPDLLLPSVSKLFLSPAWLVGVKLEAGEVEIPNAISSELLGQLFNEHGDMVHELRKQAKRVRYQMELFTDFYSSTYQNYLNDIKEIQQILGQIQDSFVLAGFLTNTLNSEIAVELPTLATQLTEARHQAWQEWQPLQQRYLDPQVRKDFHLAVLQPVSTTVSKPVQGAE